MFDVRVKEREKFCKIIMETFPDIEATVGGQISIDIYALGMNKSQIIKHIKGPIYFFGDKTKKGENDYAIANNHNNIGLKLFNMYECSSSIWNIYKY